jgi:precorrin-8X/cobalt-precorrin-8 methylmutase
VVALYSLYNLVSPARFPAESPPVSRLRPIPELDRLDHPIFTESIRRIRLALETDGHLDAGHWSQLTVLQQELVLRLIHSSGDLSLAAQVCWSPGACEAGVLALAAGAPLLADTAMAAAAVAPMAQRTFQNSVYTVLHWAPDRAPTGGTRTAAGMARALAALPSAVVLIGSAPTALEMLLQLVADRSVPAPALVVGMPVGFVGVTESKRHLAQSNLAQIRLEGSRGGAAVAAAAVNALLRSAWLDRH